LNVTMPSKTVHLEGDFARLVQVVGNLINNAAKYTGHGGTISVTIEQGDGRSDTKDTVLIRVRDNGRGIDPKSLKKLFDIFYQESRNLDRSDGGLGLGLSLVKSLVELHGGWVEARSAGLGAGSEFTVCLPCLPQEPPVAHEDADRSLRTIGRHRILLVEDNIDVADSMTLLLKLYGQEVTLARNGQEAVEMALRERPDAVLMDIGLPFVDGYQACRAMRSEGLTDLLIVAVTGYGQESDKQKAAEAGFDQHMTKPLEAQAIMQLLASLPAMH
jgi:CheY-like chemotaxis protein